MAYERTWAFSYNNAYTPTSNADQTTYQAWALKAMLLGQLGGLVSGLWTTYGSCDGAGNFGNGDLVDRWGSTYDPTKIVLNNAGSAHSWYVLKSPLMNGFNFYLLIAADSSPTGNIRLYMARTAFAAGSNTANPTSANSWNVGNQTAFNAGNSAGVLNRFNMALSSVGDFVFFPVQVGQTSSSECATLCIAAVAPVGCNGSDNFPIWTFKHFVSTAPGGFSGASLFPNNTTDGAALASNGTTGKQNIIGNEVTNSIQNNMPDALTGKQMAMPCRVNINFSTSWHLRGRLPDIMMIPGINPLRPPSGTTIRDGSNNVTFVLVGQLWIPCDSVVPIFV